MRELTEQEIDEVSGAVFNANGRGSTAVLAIVTQLNLATQVGVNVLSEGGTNINALTQANSSSIGVGANNVVRPPHHVVI